MSTGYPFFALALAAALIDVTLGYPQGLARRIGAPAQWLGGWLALVRKAGADWPGATTLALYLAPVGIAAAAVSVALPEGPVGFAFMALIASTLCERQSLDRRATLILRVWEDAGGRAALAEAEALGAAEDEPSLARAASSALAARFADEVVAPTLALALAGLPGAALARALALAGRTAEGRDGFAPAAAFARAALRPAEGLAALWLKLAGGAARGADAADRPASLRRALSLYRRAAALEMAALAALALFSAIVL